MNKTTAKILYIVFSVLALTVSQFWSCSTAQSIQVQNYTSSADVTAPKEEQVSKDKGNSVLVFKLLSPIKPDDNKQVITVIYSKGNHTDKTSACLPTITAIENPILIASLAHQNWVSNSILLQDESFVQQGYPLSTKGRGPPSLI